MKRIRTALLILLCLFVSTGCDGLAVVSLTHEPLTTAPAATTKQSQTPAKTQKTAATAKPTKAAAPTSQPTQTPKTADTTINIMTVGDIMCHSAQIKGAYRKDTNSYDFDYSFQYIKDIISGADLAMGNFECTLGGPDKPYSQMKYFNAPDSVIDSLKWAGFDLLSTINNHAYDTGSDGLHRTLQVIREKGLQTVGTRETAEEKPYDIIDVKGIKVGVAAYSYETNSSAGSIALNGKPVKPQDKDLVSVFYAGNTSAEVKRMKTVVQQMRDDGADIVVFFMHWGVEYQRTPSAQQKAMAQGLADAGVDIIFGSHPHVMQKIDSIDSEVTGKKTVVVYSMGNFISNMREEYMDDPYTEDCMIVDVQVTKSGETGQCEVTAVESQPTWTFMYTSGGVRRYTVVPLPQAIENPKKYGITLSKDKRKAQKSLDNTRNLLEDAVEAGLVKWSPVASN